MPQMMPINWLLLMIFFLTIFMMYNSMFYFSNLKFKISSLSNNFFKKNKTNWKW
uniref:ATP synthase complex subunit 8 n=1 Tax=Potamyia flava TaxID=761880 RepID=A0A3G1NDD4_9NEOP|nr:ATP synthase F0 subunit 8 [Potamyia flava]AUT18176.1 ATP synthase F0 subunit 8 [Potamyia flava]